MAPGVDQQQRLPDTAHGLLKLEGSRDGYFEQRRAFSLVRVFLHGGRRRGSRRPRKAAERLLWL